MNELVKEVFDDPAKVQDKLRSMGGKQEEMDAVSVYKQALAARKFYVEGVGSYPNSDVGAIKGVWAEMKELAVGKPVKKVEEPKEGIVEPAVKTKRQVK